MIGYFQMKDRIFSANDRILFPNDRIFSANDRIFSVKIVHSQPGSYSFSYDRMLKHPILY